MTWRPIFHPVELVRWLETERNRPRHALPTRAWIFDHFTPRLQLAEPRRPRPDLFAVVTTYGRPASCQRLIEALAGELPQETPLLVLHDACAHDYADARQAATRAFPDRVLWLDARERLGKPGFWITYQAAFFLAQDLAPATTLFIQDDLTFAPGALRRARALFDELGRDPERRVLNLYSGPDDEPWGRWIWSRRGPTRGGARLTQWFDLAAFLIDRAAMELLGHRIIPIPPQRFRRNPSISSGVGRQLTRRLLGRGNVYQADPSLVLHGDAPSEMNPEARARRPLDNRPGR